MTGICFGNIEYKEVLAAETSTGYVVQKYTDLSILDQKELPTCSDTTKEWLFAGWFKDEACENAYVGIHSKVTEAYAKFVPADVLSVRLQLSEGTDAETSPTTNMRLVSSVDSLNYSKVGFEIYFNGAKKPVTVQSSTVYERIVASAESGVEYNYSPKVLSAESEYFVTATLINISNANFEKNFYIRPYWKTVDGTTVYGVNRYVNVENGLSVTNVNVPVKVDKALNSPTVTVAGTTYNAEVAYYDGTYAHLNITVPNRDGVLKSISEVSASEGTVVGDTIYRNLHTTHASGDFSNPTADKTWYDENEDEFVLITSADLYGFAALVNDGVTFAQKTVYLGCDIEINKGYADHTNLAWDTSKDKDGNAFSGDATGTSYLWTKIGKGDKTGGFTGTFDGQMHTVSGIYMSVTSGGRNGLFAEVGTTATLKNFKMTNSYFKVAGTSYAGSIVGYMYGGSIENVYSDAIVDNKSQTNGGGFSTGGLIGNVDITTSDFSMNNCWFNGTATNGDRFLGGLIGALGEAESSAYKQTITNCLNTGSLPGTSTASRWVGGLFGYNYGVNLSMSHCLNAGTIGCINTTASQKSTQYSLIGNFAYSTPNISHTYATKQDDFLNYINKKSTVIANTDTSVVAESTLRGTLALTAETTKNLFTYVTDAETYENESYWAIVPGKVPVLSTFADVAEEQYQAVDTSWFNKNDSTFVLEDAADLYGLSLLTRDVDNTAGFENKTVVLDADVVINEGVTYNEAGVVGEETPNAWLPIGTATEPFKGNFDGNGNNISGLYLNATSSANGLFGYTYKDVTIQDFSLSNSYFYSSASAYSDLGSVVGRTEGGTFDSIYSDAIVYGACDYIGGLIGRVEGESNFSINNCWFDGNLTVGNSRDYVGGLVGQIRNEQNNYYRKVTNCLNSGAIKATNSGTKYMGGLIGLNNNGAGLTVENCLNVSEVQYAATVNTSNLTDKTTYLYGLIAGQVNTAAVIKNVFTITQEYIPNEGYGYSFSYEPQKAIDTICGMDAVEQLSALFETVLVNDETKVYWAITDSTPVLADFIAFVDEEVLSVAFDTSWYTDSNNYTLYDVSDLYGFAKIVNDGNDFAGKTVKLGADIEIPNSGNATEWATNAPKFDWISIGTDDAKFNGTFDGQGYTISNIYINITAGDQGLFGHTDINANIRNFSLTNSYIKSEGKMIGSIVGHAEGGQFDTIYSSAIVESSNIQIGGIIGNVEGAANFVMNNCWFAGTVTNTGGVNHTGGLIGTMYVASGYTRTIKNSLFTGVVCATQAGSRHMGGLIGYSTASTTLTVSNCLSAGEVQYQATTTDGTANSNTTVYGLIGGSLAGSPVIQYTYAIGQDNLSYFYSGKTNSTYTLEKTAIYGMNAMEQMPDLFVSTDANGNNKAYWMVTDKTPILKDFAKHAEEGELSLEVDTSWYDGSKNYVLSDVSDLYGFAVLSRMKDFSGETVKLGKDIAIQNSGNVEDWSTSAPIFGWLSIGTADVKFNGTFDGQGYEIANVYLKTSESEKGLFGHTNTSATVKNVSLVNSYFESTGGDIGSIVGRAEGGTFDSIYSDAIIKSNAVSNIGGLIGHVEGAANFAMNNCWFDGALTASNGGSQIGGLIGWVKNESNAYSRQITNCLNTGLVYAVNSASTYVGGLLGYNNSGAGLTLANCLNVGEIRYNSSVITTDNNSTKYYYGLIAGQLQNDTKVTSVYTVVQGVLPTVAYGKIPATSVMKEIAEITGTNANTSISDLFDYKDSNGVTKNYWVVTDGTPILASFVDYAEVQQIGTLVDTSWYNENDDEFTIYTAGELYGLAKLCNNRTDTFAGKTIKLGSDIKVNDGVATDWADSENLPIDMWTPIGATPGTAFAGTFDGQGRTISGLYLKSDKEYLGLFGMFNATSGATAKNFRLTNSYFVCTATSRSSSVHGLGSVVGRGVGTLEKIYSDAILVNGSTHTGGLVGSVVEAGLTLDVNNCWFTGSVTGSTQDTTAAEDFAGGLVGYVTSKVTAVNMTNCLVAADITNNLNSTIVDSETLESTSGVSYVGGLAGRIGNGQIKSCMAFGTISYAVNGYASSIAGMTLEEGLSIEQCYNATNRAEVYHNTELQTVEVTQFTDCGAENYNLQLNEKTYADYSAYLATLESKGFAKFAESVLDRVENDSTSGVWNATYTKEEIVITVVYVAKTSEISFSIGKDLPLSEHLTYKSEYLAGNQEGAKTTLHMPELHSEGDSFIIQLKNGHFILSDGGMLEDMKYLVDYLEELAPEGEKPVIEAWFISHGHSDHYGALLGLIGDAEYRQKVYIEGVYFNEPNASGLNWEHVEQLVNGISNCTTSAGMPTPIYRPQAGQRYYFNDITVDILHSQEQIETTSIAEANPRVNETSTWLLYTIDGQTFLHAGDAGEGSVEVVKNSYNQSYLDFDVMATFHHGQNVYTSYIDYFAYKTVLYTTFVTDSQTANLRTQENNTMKANAVKNGGEYMSWGDGTKILTFPYEVGAANSLGLREWTYHPDRQTPTQY